MYSIPVPKLNVLSSKTNKIGLTKTDYMGAASTLCGGCGHDSITAAIVDAFFRSSIEPHKVAKMSGIGCSSKTPGYFLGTAHGFNAIHGRMPSVTTGAYLANRNMHYIGVSGDGDTGSIGLGQFIHGIRRKLNMLYIVENNGIYGLTKGQFSAFTDFGSKNKKGEENAFAPIDPVVLALQCGASFVARSFSGDKEQLVPLIMAGLAHNGFSLIDVVSPCVSFNNHEGSTRSYHHMREFSVSFNSIADFVLEGEEITVSYKEGEHHAVTLHNGSSLILSKSEMNPEIITDRTKALMEIEKSKKSGEILTGLLYYDPLPCDFHQINHSDERALRDIAMSELTPGDSVLSELNSDFQ